MSNDRWIVECRSLDATRKLAENLARSIRVPMVVRLDGTLGAGKTQFTKFIAVALGAAPEDVTSPTFVLVHRYPTQPVLYHLDAYRVNDEDEFLELGIEEFFEEQACTLIEWGEKFVDVLPPDHLAVEIEVQSENQRLFRFEAGGTQSRDVLRSLAERMGGSA